jgi:hypothetical protein
MMFNVDNRLLEIISQQTGKSISMVEFKSANDQRRYERDMAKVKKLAKKPLDTLADYELMLLKRYNC